MSKVIWLTDRTRTTTDWTCARKRYLNYHAEGRGLVGSSMKVELFLGGVLHDALAAIAFGHQEGSVDIDMIASTAGHAVFETLNDGTDFAREQSALTEGLIRGFHRHVWPRLMLRFPKIIAIEREMAFKMDDSVTFMSRPDLILEDAEGEWVYVEYKSTGSKRDEWLNQWSTAVQVHSTIRAVEETLSKAPSQVIVQGLYKGYRAYGKLSTPFVYGYKATGQPPFSKDRYSYDYEKGFFRAPVWTFPGGSKDWIANMPEDVMSNQFPQTPPIFIKDDMIDAFFRQRLMREYEIRLALQMMESLDAEARQGVLDMAFPQKFEACNPGWGTGCEYRSVCFGDANDPLNMGYELREAHHDLEAEQHAQS